MKYLDASGNLLVELDAVCSASLVRDQEPGMFLLDAPAKRVCVDQALDGQSDAVKEQRVVVMVRRIPEDPFPLEVLAGKVELLDALAGSPVNRLRTLDGLSIVRGVLGVGVWMDGELVASNWKT